MDPKVEGIDPYHELLLTSNTWRLVSRPQLLGKVPLSELFIAYKEDNDPSRPSELGREPRRPSEFRLMKAIKPLALQPTLPPQFEVLPLHTPLGDTGDEPEHCQLDSAL